VSHALIAQSAVHSAQADEHIQTNACVAMVNFGISSLAVSQGI
jgi:hypothetical protein